MFKIGQTIICVDEKFSSHYKFDDQLQHLKEYIVDDYSDGFVTLEGVKGEWHETRFILAEEVV